MDCRSGRGRQWKDTLADQVTREPVQRIAIATRCGSKLQCAERCGGLPQRDLHSWMAHESERRKEPDQVRKTMMAGVPTAVYWPVNVRAPECWSTEKQVMASLR